jgi:predicted TIM-barrel fold metal-dependent hydrolase
MPSTSAAYAAADDYFRATTAPVDRLIEAMEGVGVDAALLVSPRIYGDDNGYALEAARRHPRRFGVIGRVDPLSDDLEARLAGWRSQPGALGLRLVIVSEEERQSFLQDRLDPFFASAERQGVPLCIYPPGLLGQVALVADMHPGLTLVIDHLGLYQPPALAPGADSFEHLPELLRLARCENVSVKLSGLPNISTERFPFTDLWPRIHPVLNAFGSARALWGSDITRVDNRHPYADSIAYLRDTGELSESDRAMILGGNVRRLFRWPSPAEGRRRKVQNRYLK